MTISAKFAAVSVSKRVGFYNALHYKHDQRAKPKPSGGRRRRKPKHARPKW